MHMSGIARIGKDVELRYTPNGDAVAQISLAFDYGKKGDNGYRPTQWVDAAMFGKRAESLAPHLLKGKKIYVMLEEPHIETYEGKNGTGTKMVARVAAVEFADSGKPAEEAPRPAARPAAKPAAKPVADFDDDVPF